MHHTIYGLLLLVPLLELFIIGNCQCPENFRYFRNETSGEISGIIEISTPPQGVTLHLRIVLSVATVLPTKYVGRIELAKSKEDSIRSILQGLPLYYRIFFPVRNPIPVVTSITLNNVHYCSGPPAVGVIVTNIILEHTLYPPRVIIPLTEQLLNFISNSSTSTPTSTEDPIITQSTIVPVITTEKDVTTTTMTAPTSTTNNLPFVQPFKKKPIDSSCGLTGESNPIISSNESTSTIMWPWIAAIFLMRDELDFQCTGNLISRQHVLTAAHCLKEDEEEVPPYMLLVSLGRFNLRNLKESGSVNVDVAEYRIHPEYKDSENADSDLAIVKLIRRIEYTPNIRPICLWMGKIELDNLVGKFGHVVGWASNNEDRKLPLEPRVSKVPIVSQNECLESNMEFKGITSNRTFCAGRRDGTGPCASDSGSGLIMYHTRYARYHLRGIVSYSLMDIRKRSCDLKEFVVYVDIAKYLPWIRQEMIS